MNHLALQRKTAFITTSRMCSSPVLSFFVALAVLSFSSSKAGAVPELIESIKSGLAQENAEEEGNPIRSAPLIIPENPRLERDYQTQQREWLRRVWETGFAKRAGNQPWFKDAAAYISDTFDHWDRPKSDALLKDFVRRGREAIDQGAKDPLVLFLESCALSASGEGRAEIAAYAEQAFQQAKSDGSVEPSLLARLITWRLSRAGSDQASESDTAELVRLLGEAVEHGEYTPADGEILVRHLFIPRTFKKSPELFLKITESAKLDEVSRLTIRGFVEIELAWKVRGTGYANTVTNEGWKGFEEHLKLARTALVKAWELDPKRPQAPSKMITVAMGLDEGNQGERLWFDRAVAAQFDFHPAYDAYLWSLRPRWGGSHKAMLEFGKACLATARFDTDVPTFYSQAIFEIAGELDSPRAYFLNPEIAPDIMRLSQKLLEEPTRESERLKRQEMMATCAWLTGDYALAYQVLDTLDWNLSPFVNQKLKVVRSTPQDMMLEVALRQSGAYEAYQTAEAARLRGDLQEAGAGYREILEKIPSQLKGLVDEKLRAVDRDSALIQKAK